MVDVMSAVRKAFSSKARWWGYGAMIVAAAALAYLAELRQLFFNNGALFASASVAFSAAIAVLFGVNVALMAYRWQAADKSKDVGITASVGGFLGALASGCPVCGTGALATLGVVGGLGVLPLKGFELKFLSVGLLGASIFFSAKAVELKDCKTCKV
ncbi:hypothetical protein HY642_04190 [Candidatus Woesearchaeota archaeon]|nr:hypothetical protein [Candidatus Woesearchaeota archaeon]